MNKVDVIKIRDEILHKALPHVAFDGWVWATVVLGAQEAGYDEPMARAVFPAQVVDALDGLSDMADRGMMEALAQVDPAELRIRDRIATALLARFEVLQPYKDAVKQSSSFWAIPTRKPRGAKIVWRTADLIWDWAGDESTDYNRYTKRGLLSGIIVSTTLAWFEDDGESMDSTKAFLDRRIENVMQLGKVVGRFKGRVKNRDKNRDIKKAS